MALFVMALLPYPFEIKPYRVYEDRPGKNVRVIDYQSIDIACGASLLGNTKAIKRDFLILEYMANPFLEFIDKDFEEAAEKPHGNFRITVSEISLIRDRFPHRTCTSANGTQKCLTQIDAKKFDALIGKCASSSPMYENEVGSTVNWLVFDNLSRVNAGVVGWTIIVAVLSTGLLIFSRVFARLWRWVRFG